MVWWPYIGSAPPDVRNSVVMNRSRQVARPTKAGKDKPFRVAIALCLYGRAVAAELESRQSQYISLSRPPQPRRPTDEAHLHLNNYAPREVLHLALSVFLLGSERSRHPEIKGAACLPSRPAVGTSKGPAYLPNAEPST